MYRFDTQSDTICIPQVDGRKYSIVPWYERRTAPDYFLIATNRFFE